MRWLARHQCGDRRQLPARIGDPRVGAVGGKSAERRLANDERRAKRQRLANVGVTIGTLAANGDETRARRHRARVVGDAGHLALVSAIAFLG